ncbi:MAG: tetratricopeptide repeat protein [Balneolaceae bacterium]|nr:tetratricopeptide repeat protein [Balneolaceae bacterium]
MQQTLIPVITLTLCCWIAPDRGIGQSAEIDTLENHLQKAQGLERVSLLAEHLPDIVREHPEYTLDRTEEALNLLSRSPAGSPNIEIQLLELRGWAFVYRNDLDSAWHYAVRAENMARLLKQTALIARPVLLRARIMRERGELESALSALQEAEEAASAAGDPQIRARVFNEIGSIQRRKGLARQARRYHQQALVLFREAGDRAGEATTLGFLGIANDMLGHYDQALRHHQESIRIREALGDRRGVAASLTNIGILNQKIEKYDEATVFYKRALEIWDDLKLEHEIATTRNNLGAVYELRQNYPQALAYYQEAYTIWKNMGTPYNISIALYNIGNIRMYLGDYREALSLMNQSLELRLEMGDLSGSASTYGSIAKLYDNIGQPDSALAAARSSLEQAQKTGSWSSIRNAHEIMAELYESGNNHKEALAHYKAFKAAHDTLFNLESRSTIAEMQERFRTREQQQQIELLQRNQEVQNLWLGIFIGGFSLSLIVLGLLYKQYQLKERAHKVLQQLHENEIEKASLRTEAAETKSKLLQAENKRKSEELEAARSLQLSMLPATIPDLEQAELAAYMKTATEVGGDYYDFKLLGRDELVICIGDGTGHGAKAGTLVTATKSIFNLMSGDEELTRFMTKASEAIKMMRFQTLYMALALARLRGNTLELVGAGMPPAVIYRAKTDTVETVPLKGMPLGTVVDYPYQRTSVTLHTNDIVLLLSDGFPELNNAAGEQLGYERIPNLLKESATKQPNAIINYLREVGSNWIAESEQDDDITFIIFKMK